MFAQIFREEKYNPSAITAVCSNNKAMLLVFRRNRTIEFLDPNTLKCFLCLNIQYNIKDAHFLDSNTAVILAITGELLVLDTRLIKLQKVEDTASNVHARLAELEYAEKNFIYSTRRNEVYEVSENKLKMITMEKSPISALLMGHDCIIVGTCKAAASDPADHGKANASGGHNSQSGAADGLIKIFQQKKLSGEIKINTVVSRICQISECLYGLACCDGSLRLLDTKRNDIIDMVTARSHELTTICYVGNKVHVSGIDSRISCYEVREDKFIRCFQGDYHFSAVLSMAVYKNKILTAGEDTSLVITSVEGDRYYGEKIYQEFVSYGTTNDHFYVATEHALCLYGLIANDPDSDAKRPFGPDNSGNSTKKSIVLSEITDGTNLSPSPFEFFLEFKSRLPISCAAVRKDERYFAVSNTKETVLYSLLQGEKMNIEPCKTFSVAKQLLFVDRYLFVMELNKKIVIFNLESFEVEKIVPYGSYQEIMYVIPRDSYDSAGDATEDDKPGNDSAADAGLDVILSFSKTAISLKGLAVRKNVNLPDFIKDINDGWILSGERLVKWSNEYSVPKHVRYLAEGYYSDTRHVYSFGNESKYEIGPVIQGLMRSGDVLIVLQTSLSNLQMRVKKGVFKEKYSNR